MKNKEEILKSSQRNKSITKRGTMARVTLSSLEIIQEITQENDAFEILGVRIMCIV
jgi:hypothetical protein